MSTVNGYAMGGLTSFNYYNNQPALHADAKQLLSRLFPQDQVSLSANAKLMLSISEMLKAANNDESSPDQAALWAKLRELSDDAAKQIELWAGDADATAAGTQYAAGTLVVTDASATRVKGYERAVVSGTSGGDKITAMNDAVVSGGTGNDYVFARASSVVSGGAGGDWLSAGANSIVSGGEGDDYVHTGAEGVVISGDDGQDIIRSGDRAVIAGGAGHDLIFAKNDAAISAGDGADIVVAGRNAMVSGGAGNDMMTVGANATVEGGAGIDSIYVGHHSTLVFGRGDGQDHIFGYLRSGDARAINAADTSGFVTDSTIQLRDVNASDVTITRKGDDLTIAINGTEDRMTIHGYSDKDNLQVEFADGTSAALADLPRQESAV
jgi:hypothetical protein